MIKIIENSEIFKAWSATEDFYNKIFSNQKPSLYINDSQPGTSKTYGLANAVAKKHKKIAFFTANHNHLEKFKKDLVKLGVKNCDIIHGKGFEKSCKRYPSPLKNKRNWTSDEAFIYKIYSNLGVRSSRYLCSHCDKRRKCEYYTYMHNTKTYQITLQPLEFLPTNYNDDKFIFVIDEAVTKKEKILWNYNQKKLNIFIETIEAIAEEGKPYELRKFSDDIFQAHRTLLQRTSIIFKESTRTLFTIEDNTFKKREYQDKGFIQKGKLITHPEEILLDFNLPNDNIRYNISKLSVKDHESGIIKYADKQIRKTIRNADENKIDDIIKNNIPLRTWLKFLNILLHKNPGEKTGLLVCEKLEILKEDELSQGGRTKIKTTYGFEYGFIDESPYVLNKSSGRVIISRMGKDLTNSKTNVEYQKDTWFIVGHPFLFKAFDIALKKPVIILDATYNNLIFDKLLDQWLMLNTTGEIIKNPGVNDEDILTKYRKNIDKINSLNISNRNSTVYNVEKHFPLSTLGSGKIKEVKGLIDSVVDNNPGKSYAIISHKRFEDQFKRIFEKAQTAHHLNERGKDIDRDLLFVVGTPFPPPGTHILDYVRTFNELPKNIEKRDTEHFTGFKDPLLHAIFKTNVTDENYQELHRTRMLLYNREVYALCELPDKIKEEVTVKDIPDINSVSNSALWGFLDIIRRDDGETLTFYYKEIKNRKKYEEAGGFKTLVERAQKDGYITLKREKTTTKPATRAYITEKGKKFRKTKSIFFYR